MSVFFTLIRLRFCMNINLFFVCICFEILAFLYASYANFLQACAVFIQHGFCFISSYGWNCCVTYELHDVQNILVYMLKLNQIWSEPPHDKTNKNDCAPSKDSSAWASPQSDQSSLCAQWVAKDPSFLHADSEDWVDVQADLCWAHMPFCWFCHEVAHFCVQCVIVVFKAKRKVFSNVTDCTSFISTSNSFSNKQNEGYSVSFKLSSPWFNQCSCFQDLLHTIWQLLLYETSFLHNLWCDQTDLLHVKCIVVKIWNPK